MAALKKAPNVNPALPVLVILAASCCAWAAPQVNKVDPPNWWVGMPNPMLLISGEELSGAVVKAETAGTQVIRTEVEATGHYLFVWLNTSRARPGTTNFTVRTPQGTVIVPFSFEARKPPNKGFQGFNEDDVIYLIMPDRFADGDPSNDSPPQSPGTYDRAKPRAYHGGDLRGVRQHLSYLRELGVTTLWITPIYDNDDHSPEDYHGYAAVDFYRVDEHLGTLKDYQDLVEAAHLQGMKVLLDVVVNHSGMNHPWLERPPAPGWYNGTRSNHLVSDGMFQRLVDQHIAPDQWREVVDGWFFDVLPDLNQNNPAMAQYLIQNAIWWAEEGGLDGFRLDTFPYVPRVFWSNFHKELFQTYPRFETVGEVFYRDPTVTSFFAGGQRRYDGVDSGVSTVFDFPFFFAIRDVMLRDKPATLLEDVLKDDWIYSQPEMLVTFVGNHDTVRFMGEPGASREKLKSAFSLLLTTRGVPQVYYGDEIGMAGGADPDNRRDFPGGFPGDGRDAFTPQGRTQDEQEIFAYVESLLRLRKQHPALRRGKQWCIDEGKDYFAYARVTGEDRILVVLNNSDNRAHLRLNLTNTLLAAVHQLEPLLDAAPGMFGEGAFEVEVAPRSAAIYQGK